MSGWDDFAGLSESRIKKFYHSHLRRHKLGKRNLEKDPVPLPQKILFKRYFPSTSMGNIGLFDFFLSVTFFVMAFVALLEGSKSVDRRPRKTRLQSERSIQIFAPLRWTLSVHFEAKQGQTTFKNLLHLLS